MSWKDAFSIVGTITKWIDEWKSKADERRLLKIQKLKDELSDVEKRLIKFKNFKNMANYREYIKLLNSKRVLGRRIDSLES